MTTAFDPHQPGGTGAPPATDHEVGRGRFVLGVVIGAAVSVALLLPTTINALTGSALLDPVAEYGFVTVVALAVLLLVIWAVVDGVPAWRARGKAGLEGVTR